MFGGFCVEFGDFFLLSSIVFNVVRHLVAVSKSFFFYYWFWLSGRRMWKYLGITRVDTVFHLGFCYVFCILLLVFSVHFRDGSF